jgi:DNA-binding GntR family transcriptional regulator
MADMRASDVAYERLRDDIIQWRLQPGTPLGEVEVSARVGVSRTPVREALSRLIAEGLVSNNSGRTAVVAPVSHAHVRQLFELREALEMQAARLAARRRDPKDFEELKRDLLAGEHVEDLSGADTSYVLADRLDAAIDRAMNNEYLLGALKDIRGHLIRVRRHAHSNPGRLAQAAAEHVLIVGAILQQDELLAAQATAVHLHNSLANILSSIPEFPESPSRKPPRGPQ